jgi:GNAT superfamily N-acetyltransferase
MIKKLEWDSTFFGKKIGELRGYPSFTNISPIIEKAKKQGYQYILYRLKSQKTPLIQLLESYGFYLTDIGITWEIKNDQFTYGEKKADQRMVNSVRVATEKDIPMLKKMITSLFLESRFYSDPFFSKKDADRLYQAWIENSVRKQTANIVYIIPEVGFIACKKASAKSGEIKLIGIKEDFRGKGIGKILLWVSFKWFEKQRIRVIKARTQLKNLPAMNFYARSCFSMKGFDLIFAKILS